MRYILILALALLATPATAQSALALALLATPATAQSAGDRMPTQYICLGDPSNLQAVVDKHDQRALEEAKAMFMALVRTGVCAMLPGVPVVLIAPVGPVVKIEEDGLNLQVWKVRAADSDDAFGFVVLNMAGVDA